MRSLLARRPLLALWAIGTVAGLVFGLGYFYVWGCRKCAKNASPVSIALVCGGLGGAMAGTWGKDHLRS